MKTFHCAQCPRQATGEIPPIGWCIKTFENAWLCEECVSPEPPADTFDLDYEE